MEINKIYCGDCVDVMKTFSDNSIDLIVTSPPYDNLRKYNGYTFDFENTAKELFRVTKVGGIIVWVVGDSTIKGSETGNSFKQALYLHDTMIYAKSSPIPLTHNRYEQQFEYMFVFSKGKPKTFNPIMQPCKTAGYKKNRHKEKEYENTYSTRRREEITITKNTKYMYNIWYYPTGKNDKTKHNAPFPEKLAYDHIISWSNENDLIFDPMCGSGTTLKEAKILNRHYIGIDISEEYVNITKDRLKNI